VGVVGWLIDETWDGVRFKVILSICILVPSLDAAEQTDELDAACMIRTNPVV
jgi:hypothetical protein